MAGVDSNAAMQSFVPINRLATGGHQLTLVTGCCMESDLARVFMRVAAGGELR